MLTKDKGDIAVASAIAHYMSSGYEVCLPIGDKRPYDLVVEKRTTLKRVQVKFAGFYTGVQQHKVALRITGGNQSFNSTKKYADNDFDELYVFTANKRIFILPWKDVKVRNEINIENKKYSDYEVH